MSLVRLSRALLLEGREQMETETPSHEAPVYQQQKHDLTQADRGAPFAQEDALLRWPYRAMRQEN